MRIPKPAAAFSRNRRGISIPGALAALWCLAFWSVTQPAHAQAPAAKRTILRPGRVLDVRTGELRSNQAIVIENERIAEIASAGEVKAAAGDATVDLPEATLLPGLIDMHTHLTMDLGSLGYSGLGISTAREALHGARDRKSTRLNSSHLGRSYAVFCLKKNKNKQGNIRPECEILDGRFSEPADTD